MSNYSLIQIQQSMARPLSEAKREAILEAACKLVAEHGTGAPTAKIAREARLTSGVDASGRGKRARR